MSRGAKAGIWILILVVVIALFAMTAVRRLEKEEVLSIRDVQESEGIPVDIIRTRALPIEDWREFAGVAEGYEQVNLVAPFRTLVEGVHVRVGDEVAAGKVIISLDPYDPTLFAMNLKTAETQYRTAKRDSIRLEELFKSGAISQQELDHARASTEAARAHYLTARRAVELDTPISGVVTAVSVEAGDYAAGEQTVATIASYDRIRVPLELSESERALVREGQAVRLFVDASRSGAVDCPGKGTTGNRDTGTAPTLKGNVVKVALSADPETRLFSIEVILNNPQHLFQPGTLVTPEIRVASTKDQPLLPPGALLKHDGLDRIFVIDESGEHPVARLREVTRGLENGVFVAIPSGLSSGEKVVVQGQNKLKDGIRVKIHADVTAEYFEPGI
ncbi:MAG: efflux RND transporter periplasmic adaptor subunit [Gemmatimonadota bacterium]|nr:MAG: efflux RND transporter periplasmic adaptor subunit [Gemmatimonadota bacterium]